ncbi:MAG: D-alanyl-D-alanine carboxypeptidase [Clostridia bacterium]|nr:D-alanyl-D-alanine carboxypeptidase [Clostridia bacterium]
MKKRIRTICIVLSALFTFPSAPAYAGTGSAAPRVSAESAFLMEADVGDVIFETEAKKRLPMASTTKIMTALVALGSGDLDEPFPVPPEAVGVEGSSVYLTEGETVTLRDLIFALMLESANDAATAIAYRVAGSVEKFADLMNEKAKELELNDTHFTNPHGLDDPDHFTTAFDLAKLTCAALRDPEFERIVSKRSAVAFSGGSERTLVNHNRLLRSLDGTIGVKTGFTKKSGRCLVSAVRRDGVLTVAVTLNDPNDWSDHRAMHEYGQSLYQNCKLSEPGTVKVDLPVIGGNASRVRCSSCDTFSAVVKKGQKTKMTVEAPRFVAAPVKRGDALGKAVFHVGGVFLGSVPLYAENDVSERTEKRTFFEKILEFLGKATG